MSRRKVIALMIANPGLSRDYQGALRAGVEQRCAQAGVDLWVYSGRTDWQPYGPHRGLIYELIDADRVDGIILGGAVIACFLDLPQLYARLRERCPVPMCSTGSCLEGVPSIITDNGVGMGQVVEHLAGHHGFRQFGFIAGPQGHEESEERLRATRSVLAGYGLELPPEAVVHGNFSHQSGAEGMRELTQRLTALRAVVVANDDMAAGALKALTDLGMDCPAEVAVVGFDDAMSARVSSPAMTTVRQPVYQMGALAADSIMAQWRGETCPAVTTLRTEVVVRQSCGCDPIRGSRRPEDEGDSVRTTQEEIDALLAGLVGERRVVWRDELWRALEAECSDGAGALGRVLGELLDSVSQPDAQLFDLQRVVNCLRSARLDMSRGVDLSDVYHHALLQIGYAMQRRDTLRQVNDNFVLEELRVNWRRIGTSLSFDSLRKVLVRELPRFSVQNAVVSVYPPDDFEHLVPVACLIEGVPVTLPVRPFPARELRPEGASGSPSRCTLAVMPLTFEREPLGVAMLELPAHEAYHMLRDQIGSAIKTVRLHETLMQQQERLKVQAQAENRATAERLRSMSMVAGGVAHDLNNAIGPLLALPGAILEDLSTGVSVSPERFVADLEALSEAAQHAAHTIQDLLALGRTIDAPMQVHDVNRILARERRSLGQLTERTEGVRLNLVMADRALPVRVSREHLLRAVSNLVANATDAMTGPGEVVARVTERHLVERLEGVEPVEPGHYVVVEVEDTGCGIPHEHLPHILEPFFSSKSETARGGTGLGLAIAHQVVRQSGGYLHVRSQVGVGTCFALFLPLVANEATVHSVPPRPVVGGNEWILVVDDEQLQLRTARRLLKQLGYRVSTASSGAAAVELFKQHLDDEPFALVILDVMMPGALNGLEALQEIRKHKSSQRALLASGYAPEELERNAAELSTDWLAKPYTREAFARAVRGALERSSQPPTIALSRDVEQAVGDHR